MKDLPIMVSFKLLAKEQKYLSVPNLSDVALKKQSPFKTKLFSYFVSGLWFSCKSAFWYAIGNQRSV